MSGQPPSSQVDVFAEIETQCNEIAEDYIQVFLYGRKLK